MRRLSLAGTGLLLLLGACTTAPTPLQVADEHPSFASCATFVQASYPGQQAADARAAALQQCLTRNPTANQVAMRLG
jgi:starvation-inducible outer membrane lipoprotein